jgi:hypothetical protein
MRIDPSTGFCNAFLLGSKYAVLAFAPLRQLPFPYMYIKSPSEPQFDRLSKYLCVESYE